MGVFKNDVGRPTNETIKKRRILKSIVAILVAGALFTGGYYVNEYINKVDVNKEDSISSKIILKETLGEEASAEFTYNKKVYNLRVKTKEESVLVFLNEKNIYEVFAPVGLGNIYLLDDLLVIHTYSGDVRGQGLVFVDFEGTVVKEIVDITEGNLVLNIGTRDDNISIKNDTITLNMTARTHGETLVYKDNNDIEGSMPYSESVKSKYNINDDTIIDATYEFKYLGNKKFSEMKIVNKKTYKEYVESQGLTDENVSIEEAEKIMTRVFGKDYNWSLLYSFGTSINESKMKTVWAINNSEKVSEYTCKKLYGNNLGEYNSLLNNKYFDEYDSCAEEIYLYDDVNKIYKSYFGNKSSALKETLNLSDLFLYSYEYFEKEKLFSKVNHMGGDGGTFPMGGVISSYKENNKVYVTVVYGLSVYDFGSTYDLELADGTTVKLSEQEIENKEIYKKYQDKLEKYEFVFFEEDGLYKFESVEKIKGE